MKKKDRRHYKRKLNCEFIRINASRENYDASYEASRIQKFISKLKDKEKENEVRELKDKINKLKLQLANLSVENNDNYKK